MTRVREEVFELIFAGAVVDVFGSAAAALFDRISRGVLLALTGVVAAAAAAAWVAFALEPARGLGIAAGGLTVCAALQLATVVVRRLVGRAKDVERQIADAEARLDSLVTRETEARAAEIERTLARARADSLSRLVGEERRIAEERRAALAE